MPIAAKLTALLTALSLLFSRSPCTFSDSALGGLFERLAQAMPLAKTTAWHSASAEIGGQGWRITFGTEAEWGDRLERAQRDWKKEKDGAVYTNEYMEYADGDDFGFTLFGREYLFHANGMIWHTADTVSEEQGKEALLSGEEVYAQLFLPDGTARRDVLTDMMWAVSYDYPNGRITVRVDPSPWSEDRREHFEKQTPLEEPLAEALVSDAVVYGAEDFPSRTAVHYAPQGVISVTSNAEALYPQALEVMALVLEELGLQ